MRGGEHRWGASTVRQGGDARALARPAPGFPSDAAHLVDLCIINRHPRSARLPFGYETSWKPRGAGATAATRDRPGEGGRFDYGRGPSARMLTQFGHPLRLTSVPPCASPTSSTENSAYPSTGRMWDACSRP